jgi:hypothetical protein
MRSEAGCGFNLLKNAGLRPTPHHTAPHKGEKKKKEKKSGFLEFYL